MTDNGMTDPHESIYDMCLKTSREWACAYNPRMEYMSFMDRFELHIATWQSRYGPADTNHENRERD